ncbi:MAG: FtsQ-type POTRA domain-containing protein [Rhodospirillaceae bacterium]|nr:FtsQ-type POTRA domain-containing protein [Rhodospirillaceae bacterium]
MRWMIPSALTSRAVLLGTAAFAIAGVSLIVVKLGGLPLAVDTERLAATAIDASASLGMRLQKLTVEGRDMTSREDLLAAVDAERGTPILAIDMAKARAQIEALPWVKSAKLERHLPDAVRIEIEERTPYALWQQDKRYFLVDRDGKPIIEVPEVDAAAQSLPMIVGNDAPRNAPALFATIETNPDLAARVRAAVRVGERRWNLYLDSFENGIAVRLPEEGFAAAWTRLGLLEKDHQILERDLEFIDLRLEDRLIVRVHKDPNAPTKPGAVKKAVMPAKKDA